VELRRRRANWLARDGRCMGSSSLTDRRRRFVGEAMAAEDEPPTGLPGSRDSGPGDTMMMGTEL
jgi:hypothetical protein